MKHILILLILIIPLSALGEEIPHDYPKDPVKLAKWVIKIDLAPYANSCGDETKDGRLRHSIANAKFRLNLNLLKDEVPHEVRRDYAVLLLKGLLKFSIPKNPSNPIDPTIDEEATKKYRGKIKKMQEILLGVK